MSNKPTIDELVKLVGEYAEDNVSLENLPEFLSKFRDQVVFHRGRKEGRIIVWKRGGRLAEFDDSRLYYSLVNIADAAGGYINDSDIKSITAAVKEQIHKERPNNIIASNELKRMIEINLRDQGFEQIANTYMYLA